MLKPLITVIVPVYNSKDLLIDCVHSILRQSYANLQIILVDDGSTDGSGDICEEFVKYDFRVQVIHQQNNGIGSAQNAGLNIATGEYITFCDNDDLMHHRMIEYLYTILVNNQADMSKCGWHNIGQSKASAKYQEDATKPLAKAKVVVFDDVANKYQSIFSKIGRLLSKNGEYMYFHEGNWSKLYRASIFKNLRFPEQCYAQDVYINTELHLRIKKCASSRLPLYYWLQHEQSVTHTLRKFKFHTDILNSAFHNIDIANQHKIFAKRSYFHLVTTIKLLKMTADTPEKLEQFKEYKQQYRNYLKQLKLLQRCKLIVAVILRTIETITYSLTIDKRK